MSHPSDDIVAALRSPSAEDRARIFKAYDFAARVHAGEMRKSGDPYITHPHAIALSLARLGMDIDTVVAGILHDTIEDTAVTPEEIETEFGKDVRFLVEGVTKLSKLKYRGMERHVESLRRLLVATAHDMRVIIIKMADRLHNMQTLSALPPDKQKRIAQETLKVYVPIAERLGMGTMKAALEDLAFKAVNPTRATQLSTVIAEKGRNATDSLNDDMRDVKKALAEAGLRAFHTESRMKSVASTARKLDEKETDDIDAVFDLFAMRIIVASPEECYRALGVVHALWRPVPGRVKDYIAFPKPNGYRALHTTVLTKRATTLEVQILDESMHTENQFGVASHFNYKYEKPGARKTSTSWVENVLAESFFVEHMFVMTPKGDVIDLPADATPIDFAYAIHAAIGNTMTGAKVNGKMATLNAPLKNGDVVEIVTKKNGLPNKKWLEFAKTAAARHHIRSALSKKK